MAGRAEMAPAMAAEEKAVMATVTVVAARSRQVTLADSAGASGEEELPAMGRAVVAWRGRAAKAVARKEARAGVDAAEEQGEERVAAAAWRAVLVARAVVVMVAARAFR